MSSQLFERAVKTALTLTLALVSPLEALLHNHTGAGDTTAAHDPSLVIEVTVWVAK